MLVFFFIYIYKKLLAQSIWGGEGRRKKKEIVTVPFPVGNPLNGSDIAVKIIFIFFF